MTLLAEWAPTLVGGGLSIASAVCLIRIRYAASKDRKTADDAVERHFNVLEAIREGVCIVDADLRVTHMNDEAERILDRTAEGGVGFLLADASDPLAAALIPDINSARRSGLPIERTHAFPALLRWIEVRIMPTADETLISLRDVSAQRLAESQLNANSHSLQLVENNVDAVLWTVGRDGRFSAVSGGALGELGLASAALIGRPCGVLVSEDLIGEVFTGRHVRAQSVHGEHWLQHHIEPLADRDGEIIGAVGVSINITELKRTQRELYDAAHSDRLTALPVSPTTPALDAAYTLCPSLPCTPSSEVMLTIEPLLLRAISLAAPCKWWMAPARLICSVSRTSSSLIMPIKAPRMMPAPLTSTSSRLKRLKTA